MWLKIKDTTVCTYPWDDNYNDNNHDNFQLWKTSYMNNIDN